MPGYDATQPVPTEPTSKWGRWSKRIAAAVALVVAGLALVTNLDRFANRNTLPACDSSRAKDTLSDIHKKSQVDASAYREIRELSRTDDAVMCHASLSLKNGAALSYDFKLYKEGDEMKLIISNAKDEP